MSNWGHGGRPRIRWDAEMLACLIAMRRAGAPLNDCAKRIGVAPSVARKKARELGIAGRLRSGPGPLRLPPALLPGAAL